MADRVKLSTIEDFGRAIRALRKERGLTQENLALSIGATRKLVSDMENGKRGVSLATAFLAARELGMDIIGKPRK